MDLAKTGNYLGLKAWTVYDGPDPGNILCKKKFKYPKVKSLKTLDEIFFSKILLVTVRLEWGGKWVGSSGKNMRNRPKYVR